MRRTPIICWLVVVLTLIVQLASAQPQENPRPPEEKEPSAAVPDLADIVSLAGKVNSRLNDLERQMKRGLNLSAIDKQYSGIEERLRDLIQNLDRLNQSQDYIYNQLVRLREKINGENELYQVISLPVRQEIRRLEGWRKSWQAEQEKWHAWRASLQVEGEADRLQITFIKVKDTIERALERVLSRLTAVLAVHERGGDIQDDIDALNVELTALIEEERRSSLLDKSPPILSVAFFSQFRGGAMWSRSMEAIGKIAWPGGHFFEENGWIVFIQIILTVVIIISITRNRPLIGQSERWRFLSERPLSAGLFLGYMLTVLFYEYAAGVPFSWTVIITAVAAISFARLISALTNRAWITKFVSGLMVLLIATYLVDLINLPIAIFRLFTLVAALSSLIFCWHLTSSSAQLQEVKGYRWLFHLGAFFFAFIIFAELWGKRALASYLFAALIDSAATIVVFLLFFYMMRGALETLFRHSPLRGTALLPSDDTDTLVVRLSHLLEIIIVGLVLLPDILVTWGAYENLTEATRGLLTVGFTLGSQRISIGLILLSTGILYGAFLTSWIIQKLLVDEVLFKRQLAKGIRFSIGRLIHYAIVIAGFLLALSALGFEISKITIMLSALSVGIGFGLQSIANNFVSGLILLFERPVRVGDVIQIGGEWAEIKNIGIRATTVQTFDRADRIIPNANLISNEVTNWTLTNRQIRLIIPVGVAYGSDVDRVTQTLLACAQTNPQVEKRPDPKVLFLNFGESSLDFELRVYVADFDHRIDVRSALHHQIDRSFREAGIEIAFPQRDLHLRSVDDSTGTQPTTA
ncbi:MAG: mechanosensitive ion channel [Desulfosarcina sp.]|jgi:small-conductance mechanosensitive channel